VESTIDPLSLLDLSILQIEFAVDLLNLDIECKAGIALVWDLSTCENGVFTVQDIIHIYISIAQSSSCDIPFTTASLLGTHLLQIGHVACQKITEEFLEDLFHS